MTAKEALEKVKGLLKLHFNVADEAKDAKVFEQVTLPDGTNIQYEKLEPDAAIFIVAEDDTESPAPAGSYVLEDGSTIVVTEPGIIAEITAAAPAEQEMEATDYTPQIEALRTENAALTTLIKELESRNGAFSETIQSMFSVMEILSKESKEEPIKPPRQTAFGTQAPDREAARQRMIAAAAALLKKKK
jgi:hypothetical protein